MSQLEKRAKLLPYAINHILGKHAAIHVSPN